MLATTNKTIYQFQGSKVEIPQENIRRVDKETHYFLVGFLDKQKILTKHSEMLTSVYLQEKEIVAIENSLDCDYYVAFSNNLNPKIMKGLLRLLEISEYESEF